MKFQVDFTPVYKAFWYTSLPNSWHILEMLQGSSLKVCKVLGEPTQISEKLELITKIMFGYKTNQQIFIGISVKISNFIWCIQNDPFCFVYTVYTECSNKVACSKDVLRYNLIRKYSVSKKNEMKIARPAFCGP